MVYNTFFEKMRKKGTEQRKQMTIIVASVSESIFYSASNRRPRRLEKIPPEMI